MNEINTIKADDGQLIEYEIEATESELQRLQRLLDEVHAHDMELGNVFTFKHMDEDHNVGDEKETQDGLNQVFQQLYELGTEDTKKALQELNLHQQE